MGTVCGGLLVLSLRFQEEMDAIVVSQTMVAHMKKQQGSPVSIKA